jgi:hypothetical protein
MSSKVIAFPKSAAPQGPADLQNLTAAFVASFSTTSATMLLEGIDDLARAVDKVATIVEAMPLGEAREHAEADLETLRVQLATARSMSEKIRDA